MSLLERLEEFAEEMKDWETRKTNVLGVEIAKLPSKGDNLKLSLKITPTDEAGNPLKRKGIFITSMDQFESMQRIFADEKTMELMDAVNEMRLKVEGPDEEEDEESEEVFEL